MKRISISAIAVLMIAAAVTEARPIYGFSFGYNSNRNRTRWSIYKHGLISGYAYYSPYAAGSGHSGIVPGNYRYSPYAFGRNSTGLVADPWGSSYTDSCILYKDAGRYRTAQVRRTYQPSGTCSHLLSSPARTPRRYRQTAQATRVRRSAPATARQETNAGRAKDGKQIIARYLKGRNIDYRITRVLSIEGKTISVDFLLNDGTVILKYWNPTEILTLEKQQGHRRKFYERYLESAKGICAEHLRAGGKVFQIISADSDEILARLPLCPDLNGDEKVYALAQNEGAAAIKTVPRP
ncbi:MAG: hypothetical protein CEE38_19835 [Planctomycetes bacterium B3_Pla]|nr:MAG: hypothetical protein CEE38_19835 [Planctomycetes bacterium B3_Pla]